MGQAIEQRRCHLGIGEDARPFAKRQVRGNDDRSAFAEAADEVEQQLAARLGERQIAEFVENDEVHAGHQPPSLPARDFLGTAVRWGLGDAETLPVDRTTAPIRSDKHGYLGAGLTQKVPLCQSILLRSSEMSACNPQQPSNERRPVMTPLTELPFSLMHVTLDPDCLICSLPGQFPWQV